MRCVYSVSRSIARHHILEWRSTGALVPQEGQARQPDRGDSFRGGQLGGTRGMAVDAGMERTVYTARHY